jgi:hypothetical protein
MDQLDDGGVKHPVKSKSVWLNVIAIAGMYFLPQEKRNDPIFMQSYVAILSIANGVLRYFTKGRIDFDA